MTNDDTLDHLNHLVRVNKDAEAGFRTAAQDIRNSELESVFNGYAKQHAKFADDLQHEIVRGGGNPSDSGTVGGAAHRGWMDLKAAVTGFSAHSLLMSCADGEQSADAAYADAIVRNPSGKIHALIEKQREQIAGFRTRLMRLAEETKHVDFPKNEPLR